MLHLGAYVWAPQTNRNSRRNAMDGYAMSKSNCFIAFISLSICAMTGCSSTGGLGLWSPTFPLLSQAKEFAAAQPLPSSVPIEGCKSVLPHYFVEPGDELLIEPVDYRSDIEIPADQMVKIDGTIDLGGFGRIIVAGMTVEQIENLVIERIESLTGKRNAVNVQLLESNAAVYYVLGSVSSPGAYPLVGRETVLDAILRAGGLNGTASPCDIVLSRPTGPCECRVVMPICYRQITQMGDTTTNFQIQPGDRIYVGGRSLWEELAFWKQNQTCERCCNSRCVQRDPKAADYRNPICTLPAMPPLPFFKKENVDANPASESGEKLKLEDLPLDRLDEDRFDENSSSPSDKPGRTNPPESQLPAVAAPAERQGALSRFRRPLFQQAEPINFQSP